MHRTAAAISVRYFLKFATVKNFFSPHHFAIPARSRKGSSMKQTSVRIIKDSTTSIKGNRFLLKKTDGLSVPGAVRNKKTAPAIQIPAVTLYCIITNCRRNRPNASTASAKSAASFVPVRLMSDSSLTAMRNKTPNWHRHKNKPYHGTAGMAL